MCLAQLLNPWDIPLAWSPFHYDSNPYLRKPLCCFPFEKRIAGAEIADKSRMHLKRCKKLRQHVLLGVVPNPARILRLPRGTGVEGVSLPLKI